jgi:hypothetical protein
VRQGRHRASRNVRHAQCSGQRLWSTASYLWLFLAITWFLTGIWVERHNNKARKYDDLTVLAAKAKSKLSFDSSPGTARSVRLDSAAAPGSTWS